MNGEQISMLDLLGLTTTGSSKGSKKSHYDGRNGIISEMSKEYDRYELVSAFHKELRRGDTLMAFYWGLLLTGGGSRWYPLNYAFKVATEESHSPELKLAMLDAYKAYKYITDYDFCKALHIFCTHPQKKFSVEISDKIWRYDSMYWDGSKRDIENKVKRFTADKGSSERWKDIIGYRYVVNQLYWNYEVWALIEEFLASDEFTKALYMLNFIDDTKKSLPYFRKLAEGNDRALAFIHELDHSSIEKYLWQFDREVILLLLSSRIEELPVIEPPEENPEEISEIVNAVYSMFDNKELVPIPLYALDPHTKRGKGNWFRFRKELKIGENHPMLDLRYSGYWIGIAWRYYAYKQHGTVRVDWKDVSIPKNVFYNALWKGTYALEK